MIIFNFLNFALCISECYWKQVTVYQHHLPVKVLLHSRISEVWGLWLHPAINIYFHGYTFSYLQVHSTIINWSI